MVFVFNVIIYQEGQVFMNLINLLISLEALEAIFFDWIYLILFNS